MVRKPIQKAAEENPSATDDNLKAAQPDVDPLLVKKQKLTQQLQATNQQIMELRQQKAMFEDMIRSANDQAQQIIGALNLLKDIQNLTKKE